MLKPNTKTQDRVTYCTLMNYSSKYRYLYIGRKEIPQVFISGRMESLPILSMCTIHLSPASRVSEVVKCATSTQCQEGTGYAEGLCHPFTVSIPCIHNADCKVYPSFCNTNIHLVHFPSSLLRYEHYLYAIVTSSVKNRT